MNQQLTDSEFWDAYWQNITLPSVVNRNFSFDRCLSNVLLKRLNEVGAQGKVLEIGAAPGKWLALLASTGIYSTSGIEYSASGIEALKNNFKLIGIHPDKLYLGDFFALEPDNAFDVVMSLGFIEHFNDPIAVISQHLRWLRPGGTLVLGVPNFSGIHGYFQRKLDLKILEAHNTDIMSLGFFAGIEDKLGLKAHSIEYLGSFEPALPLRMKRVTLDTFIPKLILKTASYLRRIRIFDKVNSPSLSSYILAIYTKKE